MLYVAVTKDAAQRSIWTFYETVGLNNVDILIIKIGAIGDVVMALPMVDAINKKFPGSHITWICGETVSTLIKACNSSINIISIDEKKLLGGTIVEKLLSLAGIWKTLFARRFDLVITAHGDCRYRLLTLTVRGKERRGFGIRNGRRWPVPGRHHMSEYLRLVTKLDGPDAAQGELPVPQVALPEHIKYEMSGSSSPLVALAPGGAKNVLRDDAVRRWPAEKYAALAEMLIRDGMRVAITGALSDMWVMESFRELKVLNFIGKTDLRGLIA
ncbi:MAG: glycosyltransferase family 9 protein, partial [Nitrospirae bacterium]|nr:glycosyltransferase family 9 protein [Nitrospirota bacterium]